MGRRHISFLYQGLGAVIGEETIGSCQLQTHALVLTAVQSPGWAMNDGHCGHHCPLSGARLLPEPCPAQPSLPVPLSPLLPVPRAGTYTQYVNMIRISITCKMHNKSNAKSCPHFTARSGSAHVLHLTQIHGGWLRGDELFQSFADLHCPWQPSPSHRACPPDRSDLVLVSTEFFRLEQTFYILESNH